MRQIIIISLTAFCLWSCEEDIQDLRLVYENDFEDALSEEVIGASIHTFHGTKMSGNYNKGGFRVHLKDLDEHNYVMISFDLYIHDSWDGNQVGVGGPDYWILQVDEWETLPEVAQKLIFRTTFSNTQCSSLYCLKQSYPSEFPDSHDPRRGNNETLPGLCDPADLTKVTTRYRIEKIFRHKSKSISVRFTDELKQSNAPIEICDESWSLDNLAIRIFK